MTILKLELIAAAVAAQLILYVTNSYSEEIIFESTYLWIDKQVTLHWINSNRELLTCYVQNRVNDITMLCSKSNFRYVSTEDNPADFLMKRMSAEGFMSSHFWKNCPIWLNNIDDWPNNNWITKYIQIKKERKEEINTVSLVSATNENLPEEGLFNVRRYSSLKKLLHITVLISRFVKLVRKQSEINCSLDDHVR